MPEPHGFHRAIASTLFVAQTFGLMPVSGIFGPVHRLHFDARSVRFRYAALICLSYLVQTAFSVYWLTQKKIEFGKIVSIVFVVGNFFIALSMIRLARQWPRLMKRWADVENALARTTNVQKLRRTMMYKVKLTSFVILINSLVEHLLSIAKSVLSSHDCETIESPVKAFFLSTMQPIFFVLKYSIPVAIVGKWSNIAGTFGWGFNDLFITLVSIGLSTLMRQFNASLAELRERKLLLPPEFWIQRRHLYKQVGGLIRDLDANLGPIIVLSFANNCFFICVQMLNSLNQRRATLESIYFWFSLIYLIGRTVAVALSSAKINEESHKTIHLLRYVPNESFNLDVRRFAEQVAREKLALTGMRFFKITRRLLLSISGSIITYELVLLQFKQNDVVSDSNPCNATIANISSKDFE